MVRVFFASKGILVENRDLFLLVSLFADPNPENRRVHVIRMGRDGEKKNHTSRMIFLERLELVLDLQTEEMGRDSDFNFEQFLISILFCKIRCHIGLKITWWAKFDKQDLETEKVVQDTISKPEEGTKYVLLSTGNIWLRKKRIR